MIETFEGKEEGGGSYKLCMGFGVPYSFCASTMTRTLSSGVGFDGSIPRKERKDFPDCGCAMFVFLSVFSPFFFFDIWVYVQ